MSAVSLALLLALLAAAVWFWLRQSEPDEDEIPTGAHSPYHCVSIVPGDGCCRTAQTIKGIRFLSEEAPTLPLISCDSARCQCTFTHFADRRRGDRRNPYSATSHTFAFQGGDERRARRGRRQTDGMQVVHGL